MELIGKSLWMDAELTVYEQVVHEGLPAGQCMQCFKG